MRRPMDEATEIVETLRGIEERLRDLAVRRDSGAPPTAMPMRAAEEREGAQGAVARSSGRSARSGLGAATSTELGCQAAR